MSESERSHLITCTSEQDLSCSMTIVELDLRTEENTLNSSEEFKNQILDSKNYDAAKGTFKRDKLEIEFKNDTNLQYSFGHMTVLNPKIENGYITGIGYDKYNFEAMYGKKFKNVPNEAKSLNNKARFLQATSKLKNYYVLVPVKVKI